MSININKYCIVIVTVHRHHIRAEKQEWKTAVETNMVVKIIKVLTGRKLNRTDSYLLQLIIRVLNLLTKVSLFLCFSFYCFTVLWKHFKSIHSLLAGPYAGGVLIVRGVEFFPKFKKWVGFNKQGVRKFFSKQTSLLSVYTLKLFMKVTSYST